MPKNTNKKLELEFVRGIELLTNWAEKKKYKVSFDKKNRDEVDRIKREIKICSKQSLENQLFGLAHECGHVLIGFNSKNFRKKYPRNYEREIEENQSRQWTKVSLHQEIAEECEAWQKAEFLLNKFEITFDKNKFDKLAADCVFTYIRSAASK